jgi:hypothetical protein
VQVRFWCWVGWLSLDEEVVEGVGRAVARLVRAPRRARRCILDVMFLLLVVVRLMVVKMG